MPDQLPPHSPSAQPSTSDNPPIQANEIAHLQTLVQIHQGIFNTLPMVIAVYDVISRAEYRLAIQNLAAHQISGFGDVDITGRLLTEILPPEDAARRAEWFRKCIDASEPVEAEEHHLLPNGMIWTHITYIPLRDTHRQITQIMLMLRDMTADKERELAEQQRQADIIAMQQTTLAELSTPLLTISETTVVMPLVGAIDSQRIQQIMENLLTGVATSQAKAVILDITGVPIVDTQVASALLRASHAVSLLGSQVILTGIRPEVAQTLVGLGVDLRGIITRGTLQDGITYALRD